MKKMKDSKIDYIGEIPIEWKTSKYKYHCDSGMGNTITKVDLCDSGIPVYSATKENILFGYADKCNTVLRKGDMVIGARGTIGYPKFIEDEIATCTQTTIFSRINDSIVKKYLFYCFCAFQDEWNPQEGSGVPQLTIDNLNNGKMPYPPLKIQKSIANFLDKKCSEIDSLSADIQSQIDVLEEYKKSVITEAVTKGLNPNVEMKDSGIEWIGMISANWTLSRLKYNLSTPMKYGASEAGIDYSEDLPRYIRITDITSDGKLKEDGKLSLTLAQASNYLLTDDTVLFARSGGTVGKTFLYTKECGLSAFAGYLISGVTNKAKMLPKWLWYFSLSNSYWEWANQIFTQATIQNIGADKYSNLPITVPNIDEQKEIIMYLDEKCAEIDAIIADKKAQLETLAEYKKSLIYEYVTGKKEVAL